MKQGKHRIAFFGTPEFAIPTLDILLRNEYDICCVVTAPDKPAGRKRKPRPSAIKQFAGRKGLRVLQPANLKDMDFLTELRRCKPDLSVVVAFRILPESVWGMPAYGTINLHASLLPQYRGAAPINHAIINGEKESGVTSFFLDRDVDTGNIIAQKGIAISEEDNAGT
ncbi:MAG: methionyl-tRNA formyltransferase, partial [Flavobacteriales bacterium]